MKITDLTLKSFRSFAEIQIPTAAPVVLITGVNGAGKSSCREALRYLFTGKCQGLNDRGEGSEVLLPTFNPGGSVEVQATVDGLGSIIRHWSHLGRSLMVEGFTGTTAAQQTALLEQLKTTEPYVHAALDSDVFLKLHHAEAKALVLSLLHVAITVEGRPYTLEALDEAYATQFKARTTAKAVLKAHSVTPMPQGDEPNVVAISERLKELRTALEALTAQKGGSQATRQALEKQLADAKRRALFEDPLSAADLSAAIEDAEERLALMERDDAPAEQPVAPSKGDPKRLTFLRTQIDTLTNHQPKKGCVLDGEVPCETHKNKFNNRVKGLQAELDALPHGAVPVPVVPTDSPLTTLRKTLDGLKARKAGYDRAAAENAALETREHEIAAKLATLPSETDHSQEIITLKTRIEKGEEILRNAQAYAAAKQRHEDSVAQGKKLKAEVDRLEALVAELGPTGARVPALAAALQPFVEAVNASTLPFGWEIAVVVEPWAVLANQRPVETYSRSERYRIGIAIQLAIAKLSGLSFAVVDELDMLNTANRKILGQMLYNSDLDQIFILSTREPEVPLPVLEGCLAYRLAQHEGRSAIVERT